MSQSEDQKEPNISILIRNESRSWTTELDVEPNETIQSVKMKIEEEKGIPIDEQRLTFAGHELIIGKTLSDYNIQHRSQLSVLPPMPHTYSPSLFTGIYGSYVLIDDEPEAPQLAVVSTNDTSIILNIRKSGGTETTGYKLQYRESNYDNKEVDDMKTDWIDINIETSNQNINHKIGSLKPSTNYVFHAFVKTDIKSEYKSKPLWIATDKARFSDRWDPNYIAEGHKLTNDGHCIEMIDSWSSSYGEAVVKSPGVYRWKFRLNKLSGKHPWDVVLGVWKTKTKPQPITYHGFTRADSGYYEWGYAFAAACGHKISPGGGSTNGGEYGKRCVVGDIIELVLDLDAFTIKYNINDQDYGIMHQVENTAYRVAVTSTSDNFDGINNIVEML